MMCIINHEERLMGWLAPEMLWALLSIPIPFFLYLWAWRQRKKVVIHFSSLRLLKAARQPGQAWRVHLPASLLWLMFAVGLTALARPTAEITLPSDYRKLVIAMDVSRSMLARDVEPSRIEAAQAAVRAFIGKLPHDVRAGLVTFAGTAQVVQGITEDREALLAAVDRFELQRATATGSGLLFSIHLLRPDLAIDLEQAIYAPSAVPWPAPSTPGSDRSAAIVLLSDGRRTTGPDPIEIAQRAADLGIKVHTVAFGTEHGVIPGYEGYSFFVKVDQETLKAVAQITGGQYFYAATAEELVSAYQALQGKLTLEKKQTELSFAALTLMFALGMAAIALVWRRGQRMLPRAANER
ncbi:MAG: VWA domain-containing protein [Betaproteobacteria bacterium]|jgi:Ca-activated chloride channel homolog|nr:VWA domain-containing protein [Betaproteobacteria bacterium]NDE92684.1 VWA domain-containing protein [Betaproteobacteria bacterium]